MLLVLSLDPIDKGLLLSSLLEPAQLFIHIDKITLSLLFSRLSSPSSFSLSSYDKHSSLFIFFVALCWTCTTLSMSLLYWGVQNWTQHSIWVS